MLFIRCDVNDDGKICLKINLYVFLLKKYLIVIFKIIGKWNNGELQFIGKLDMYENLLLVYYYMASLARRLQIRVKTFPLISYVNIQFYDCPSV